MVGITRHLGDFTILNRHQHPAIRFANMTGAGVDLRHWQAFVNL